MLRSHFTGVRMPVQTRNTSTMSIRRLFRRLLPALLLATLPARAELARYEIKHFFSPPAAGVNPLAPPVEGQDGNFYGTTFAGGSTASATFRGHGTVFRMTPAGAVTSLHSFTGADGASPKTALIEARDGDFYGTTDAGGAFGVGTIFRITPAGVLTVLHSFARDNNRNFVSPGPLIEGRDGNFYGVVQLGGVYDEGYLYRLGRDGQLVHLHDFNRHVEGVWPTGPLTQASDGNFYGTTSLGTTAVNFSGGSVYRISPDGVFTTLDLFVSNATANSRDTGNSPRAGIVEGRDGYFYGTTSSGGANNQGTVFLITASGIRNLLHSFTCGVDGQDQLEPLRLGADGNFYGVTSSGATDPTCSLDAGAGTLFRITPAGVLSTLHIFIHDDGGGPSALTPARDGSFYGLTSGGSVGGVAYRLQILPGQPAVGFALAAQQTPRSNLLGQSTTAVQVLLSDATTLPVSVPFTASSTDMLLRYTVTPENGLVIRAGLTAAAIIVKVNTPPAYLRCDRTIELQLGPPVQAMLAAITRHQLIVHNYSPAAGTVCPAGAN